MGKESQGDRLDRARHALSANANRIGGETLSVWQYVRQFIVEAIDSSAARTGSPGLPERQEAFRLIAEEIAAGRDPRDIKFRRGLTATFHSNMQQAGRWIDQYERKFGHK